MADKRCFVVSHSIPVHKRIISIHLTKKHAQKSLVLFCGPFCEDFSEQATLTKRGGSQQMDRLFTACRNKPSSAWWQCVYLSRTISDICIPLNINVSTSDRSLWVWLRLSMYLIDPAASACYWVLHHCFSFKAFCVSVCANGTEIRLWFIMCFLNYVDLTWCIFDLLPSNILSQTTS